MKVPLVDHDFRGGGVIIGQKWILSAAHIFDDINFFNDWKFCFFVRMGTPEATLWGSKYNIDTIELHKGYVKDTNKDDIAILKLSSEIDYSASTKPIKMATSAYKIPLGILVSTSGFGQTCFDCDNSPDLLETEMTTIACKPQDITKICTKDPIHESTRRFRWTSRS
ncbi:trypsin-6-like [Contarinia nasturtii]|uniref:trypsin-6-like n=1 Tax=Contarinia nasturtii TaxID=265458 RepID=UPI0012D3F5A2|nr:trypsin-6-like [Contarinia nasturtii]